MNLAEAIKLLKYIFNLRSSGSITFHFDGQGNIKPELKGYPDMIRKLVVME